MRSPIAGKLPLRWAIDNPAFPQQTRMHGMPSKSLATVAATLLAAPDMDNALRLVNEELETDKHMGIVLLAFDARRSTIVDRSMDRAVTPPSGTAARATPTGGAGSAQMAIDHLPPAVRHTLLSGHRFVDIGEQPAQYARLLGITPPTDNIRLFLKGVVLDG